MDMPCCNTRVQRFRLQATLKGQACASDGQHTSKKVYTCIYVCVCVCVFVFAVWRLWCNDCDASGRQCPLALLIYIPLRDIKTYIRLHRLQLQSHTFMYMCVFVCMSACCQAIILWCASVTTPPSRCNSLYFITYMYICISIHTHLLMAIVVSWSCALTPVPTVRAVQAVPTLTV